MRSKSPDHLRFKNPKSQIAKSQPFVAGETFPVVPAKICLKGGIDATHRPWSCCSCFPVRIHRLYPRAAAAAAGERSRRLPHRVERGWGEAGEDGRGVPRSQVRVQVV